jgi:HK97 family phage portal protein
VTLLQTLRAVRSGRSVVAPRAATVESPTVPISSASILEFLGQGRTTSAGVGVTEEGAAGLPAVWRSVNIIAGTSAGLPLHAYTKNGVGGAPSRVASPLLDNPHPDLTDFELWELVFGHLALWGNAYLQKLRDPIGTVRELWPVHPSRVKAGRASDLTKAYLIDGDMDNSKTDREILHIPGFGYDGVTGVAPIRAARNGLGLAIAAEDYGGRLFANGSLASGILQTEQRLDKEQADRVQARWKERAQGLGNAHDVVVLDAGAKFQQLTIPPEDAQFLETRKFQVTEIARLFGIPPHMLMDVEKSTSWGTGIEQQGIGFVVYSLRPWLIRVERRLSKQLFPAPRYVRFSVEGLLRGDSKSRAEFYHYALTDGWMNRNEVRALEERMRVEGGDVFYMPLNMAPIGADGSAIVPAGASAASQ